MEVWRKIQHLESIIGMSSKQGDISVHWSESTMSSAEEKSKLQKDKKQAKRNGTGGDGMTFLWITGQHYGP